MNLKFIDGQKKFLKSFGKDFNNLDEFEKKDDYEAHIHGDDYVPRVIKSPSITLF